MLERLWTSIEEMAHSNLLSLLCSRPTAPVCSSTARRWAGGFTWSIWIQPQSTSAILYLPVSVYLRLSLLVFTHASYSASFGLIFVDIRELISLDDVMEELGMGPNGGLIYCMEYPIVWKHVVFLLIVVFLPSYYLVMKCPCCFTLVPIMGLELQN
jgi:hypothetical protein